MEPSGPCIALKYLYGNILYAYMNLWGKRCGSENLDMLKQSCALGAAIQDPPKRSFVSEAQVDKVRRKPVATIGASSPP